MAQTINLNFIFICSLLLINCDRSSQRPSDAIPVSVQSDNTVSNPPNLASIESLPAVKFLRNFILRQNQIADAMVPIMVRALTNPIPGLADALERSMTAFGVTSYLVGPTIARSARSLSPMMEPIVGSTDNLVVSYDPVTEVEALFDQLLTLFGLNNEQCKEAIVCKAGKEVAHDYPRLSSFLSQATSTLKLEDKFAKLLMKFLQSSDEECNASCPNLLTIEKYWKEAGEKDLKVVAREAFADTVSSTLTSFLLEARNIDVTTINSELVKSTN